MAGKPWPGSVQFDILNARGTIPEPFSKTSLAAAIGKPRGKVSASVNLLEKKGVLVRIDRGPDVGPRDAAFYRFAVVSPA